MAQSHKAKIIIAIVEKYNMLYLLGIYAKNDPARYSADANRLGCPLTHMIARLLFKTTA